METLTIQGYTNLALVYCTAKTLLYQAMRVEGESPVLLKTQFNPYPTIEELARLKCEYSLLQSLSHPGIIKSLDLIKFENRLVLVLEFLSSKTLEEWMNHQIVSLPNFYTIAIQLADILDYLHGQQVIHKDIKPENILVHPETLYVTLIDLSLSCKLSFETTALVHPNVLEGTLAYLSPEQTGRMNRVVDYRSDFYSLGVVFYEMLTGKLPFEKSDPLELIHAHLAQIPVPVHTLNPAIPAILSDLIAKLMAKNADERYFSASGIKADLLQCQQISEKRDINVQFRLGQYDIKKNLVLSQKLYGREQETEQLLEIMQRVCNDGTRELILVAGDAGIGKSSFIQEIYKPLSERQGYFIRGKFQSLQRHISYFAFIQAFKELMLYILMESKEKLSLLREKILEAVQSNGQLLIDLIPELELVIGKQPAVIELQLEAAKNRLHILFQRFVNVFATQAHPLILFIDDLQWADQASLNLMEHLFEQSRYFAIVGTYRENEVQGQHPLRFTIRFFEQQQLSLTTLHLRALTIEEICMLLKDNFGETETKIDQLASLLYEKTRGNPFFINEFLRKIFRENLLLLSTAGKWTWDIEAVSSQAFTSNVVDLIVSNIEELPLQTKRILGVASCIGYQFDLNTLSIVMQTVPSQVSNWLWPAIQRQLILPVGEMYKQVALSDEINTITPLIFYKFLHDRMQEAAEQRLSLLEKKQTHLTIGRLKLKETSDLQAESFTIVGHFNIGIDLLEDPQEKLRLAELNALAGEKAMASTAYEAAWNFFKIAISLSTEDWWKERYSWMIRVHKKFAECEHFVEHFVEAENLFKQLLVRSQNDLDRTDIYNGLAILYLLTGHSSKANEIGAKAVQLLGVPLALHPGMFHILKRIMVCKFRFSRPSVRQRLQNLPPMTDPKYLKIMQILYAIGPAAFSTNPLFLVEVGLTMIDLSIQYGYSRWAGFGFMTWVTVLTGKMADFKEAPFWADLTVKYAEKGGHFDCYTYFVLPSFYMYWYEPFCNLLEPFERSIKSAIEEGDTVMLFATTIHHLLIKIMIGKSLEEAEQEGYKDVQFFENRKNSGYYEFSSLALNCIQFLRKTKNLEENELQFLKSQLFENTKVLAAHHMGYCALAQFYCVLGLFSEGLILLNQAQLTIESMRGSFYFIDEQFYYALCLILSPSEDKKQTYEKFKKILRLFKVYSQQCAANYYMKYCLLAAEDSVFQENRLQAEDFYEKAIEAAKQQENFFFIALASERAAQFFFSIKREKFAKPYLKEAHYYYTIWGAKLKTDRLEELYPWLKRVERESLAKRLSESLTQSPTGSLDFLSILKANRAISTEIHLDQFLKKMLNILMENAGGQRGVFLREQQEILWVEAEAEIDSNSVVLLKQQAAQRDDLPLSLFAYVLRSKKAVIIQKDIPHSFNKDPYLLRSHPKSALCSAILYQNQVSGLLYLENNAVEGSFTQERLEVLDLLSAQAAISLENARIYEVTGRFVPVEFLHQLAKKNLADFERGDQVQQVMSTLFCDIRNFTTMTEKMTPAEAFKLINDFIEYMEPAIVKHQGFIDKYIGDAIMALFKGEADHAVDAAIAMLQTLESFNEDTKRSIAIGIGINTGELILGIMGGKIHLAGSVIGDSVNLASRIESLTKIYGTPLLIGEQTKEALVNPLFFNLRLIDQVKVKGKMKSVNIWEVCDVDPDPVKVLKMQTLDLFNDAREAFTKNDLKQARELFEECLKKNPADSVVKFYLERLKHQ